MPEQKIYKGWNTCLDCGFEGLLEYTLMESESYEDSEALAVMMVLHCPACDSTDNAFISAEYYAEMKVLNANDPDPDFED